MSPKLRATVSAIVGLLFLVGIGYGLLLAVRGTFRALSSVDSDIAVGIIAGAATVFVSVISIVLGKLYESRAQVQREHREKKIPVYEDLIRFMFRILIGVKTGGQPSEKEMLDFMSAFTQRMMVWGSDGVLAGWVKWRRLSIDEAAVKGDPMKLMLLYEELILTIRKDLGHKNKGLVTGDILALFVSNIDEHLPKKAG